MKIEKLRKNHKKEIIIGTILAVVIGGALTYRLTHSKYRVTQSINLATGTINYTVPDFKIMAIKISEDGTNYSDTSSVPTSEYTLNTENSICKVSDTIDSSITIEYIDGKVNFLGITLKGTKCYLYFDKYVPTASDIILANLGDNIKTSTPDFSSVATSDDGVFKAADGMYGDYTYYWRGAATTNHVIFADKCWRIVRINGDNTLRLIYNGEPTSGTCADFGSGAVVYSGTTSDRYYATSDGQYNNASYVGWTYSLGSQRTLGGTASNAKIQTENWYKDATKGNLTAYESKIADGKYCNDRDTEAGGSSGWSATGSSFNYAGYKRLVDSKAPTFDCPSGDVYTLKVGAITADEVAFAGGTYGGQNNESYYLKGDNNYWTMSPSIWAGSYARVFVVNSLGYLNCNVLVNDFNVGIRPVINLKSDITFSSGNGTQNSPYTVS